MAPASGVRRGLAAAVDARAEMRAACARPAARSPQALPGARLSLLADRSAGVGVRRVRAVQARHQSAQALAAAKSECVSQLAGAVQDRSLGTQRGSRPAALSRSPGRPATPPGRGLRNGQRAWLVAHLGSQLNAAVASGDAAATEAMLLTYCSELGELPDAQALAAALGACLRQDPSAAVPLLSRVRLALASLHWHASETATVADGACDELPLACYVAAMEALLRQGRPAEVSRVWGAMLGDGKAPDARACEAAIAALASVRQLSSAFAVLTKARDGGVPLSWRAYMPLMKSLGRSRGRGVARRLERMLHRMKADGVALHPFVYNLVLGAYVREERAGWADAVLRLLDDMRAQRLQATPSTVNAMAQAFANHGRLRDVQDVLAELHGARRRPGSGPDASPSGGGGSESATSAAAAAAAAGASAGARAPPPPLSAAGAAALARAHLAAAGEAPAVDVSGPLLSYLRSARVVVGPESVAVLVARLGHALGGQGARELLSLLRAEERQDAGLLRVLARHAMEVELDEARALRLAARLPALCGEREARAAYHQLLAAAVAGSDAASVARIVRGMQSAGLRPSQRTARLLMPLIRQRESSRAARCAALVHFGDLLGIGGVGDGSGGVVGSRLVDVAAGAGGGDALQLGELLGEPPVEREMAPVMEWLMEEGALGAARAERPRRGADGGYSRASGDVESWR